MMTAESLLSKHPVLKFTVASLFLFKGGYNENQKFSCFWCKMKDFLSLQNATILTKKFPQLFEILSFEKTTDFRSKNIF